jgi:hypothetical protein
MQIPFVIESWEPKPSKERLGHHLPRVRTQVFVGDKTNSAMGTDRLGRVAARRLAAELLMNFRHSFRRRHLAAMSSIRSLAHRPGVKGPSRHERR